MSDIYEKVLYKFCDKIKPTQQIEYYSNSDKLAIIIDPRYDDLMKAIIRQHMYFLQSSGWNLLIVSHIMYESEVKADFPNCIFGQIDEKLIYYKNGYPNITIDGYNSIMLNPSFWTSLPAENIFIFQKDCFMYKMFHDTFMEYDFVGARSVLCVMKDGEQILITNGGLSLRKKTAMLDCLEKTSFEEIHSLIRNKQNEILIEKNTYLKNEDIFFSFACELLNKNIPPINILPNFSVEAEYNIYATGHHGWNKEYHTREQALEILSANPEYKDLI